MDAPDWLKTVADSIKSQNRGAVNSQLVPAGFGVLAWSAGLGKKDPPPKRGFGDVAPAGVAVVVLPPKALVDAGGAAGVLPKIFDAGADAAGVLPKMFDVAAGVFAGADVFVAPKIFDGVVVELDDPPPNKPPPPPPVEGAGALAPKSPPVLVPAVPPPKIPPPVAGLPERAVSTNSLCVRGCAYFQRYLTERQY